MKKQREKHVLIVGNEKKWTEKYKWNYDCYKKQFQELKDELNQKRK